MNDNRTGEARVRRAHERGVMRNSWLNARFSFSFGPYRDPQWDRFGVLLALNEDVVEPASGFGMHPHHDLEIFLIPLTQPVAHADNIGNRALVQVGEVQMLRAGRGIWHSQLNSSDSARDHHLQVWIEPRTPGLPPFAEQRRFDPAQRRGRWQPIVTEDGRGGSLQVDQDVSILLACTAADKPLAYSPDRGQRAIYLHVVRGRCTLDAGGDAPIHLEAGDAWLLPLAHLQLHVTGHQNEEAEVMLFDLPAVPVPARRTAAAR